MKKAILTLSLLLTFSYVFSSNITIEKKTNKNNIKTECIYFTNFKGMDTCYVRYCITSTGSNGLETKTCTEWEEVDCNQVQLPPVIVG